MKLIDKEDLSEVFSHARQEVLRNAKDYSIEEFEIRENVLHIAQLFTETAKEIEAIPMVIINEYLGIKRKERDKNHIHSNKWELLDDEINIIEEMVKVCYPQ